MSDLPWRRIDLLSLNNAGDTPQPGKTDRLDKFLSQFHDHDICFSFLPVLYSPQPISVVRDYDKIWPIDTVDRNHSLDDSE